jgi:hypothetical protein
MPDGRLNAGTLRVPQTVRKKDSFNSRAADVPADDPVGTIERFTAGLKRVLTAEKRSARETSATKAQAQLRSADGKGDLVARASVVDERQFVVAWRQNHSQRWAHLLTRRTHVQGVRHGEEDGLPVRRRDVVQVADPNLQMVGV